VDYDKHTGQQDTRSSPLERGGGNEAVERGQHDGALRWRWRSTVVLKLEERERERGLRCRPIEEEAHGRTNPTRGQIK
jgi:hypothetical protein